MIQTPNPEALAKYEAWRNNSKPVGQNSGEPLEPPYDLSDLLERANRVGFLAGHASRDAEVAALKTKVAELEQKLWEAK